MHCFEISSFLNRMTQAFYNEFTYTGALFKAYSNTVRECFSDTALVMVPPIQGIVMVYAYETRELRIQQLSWELTRCSRELIHARTQLELSQKHSEYTRSVSLAQTVGKRKVEFDKIHAEHVSLTTRLYSSNSSVIEQWALANFPDGCSTRIQPPPAVVPKRYALDVFSTTRRFIVCLPDCNVSFAVVDLIASLNAMKVVHRLDTSLLGIGNNTVVRFDLDAPDLRLPEPLVRRLRDSTVHTIADLANVFQEPRIIPVPTDSGTLDYDAHLATTFPGLFLEPHIAPSSRVSTTLDAIVRGVLKPYPSHLTRSQLLLLFCVLQHLQ